MHANETLITDFYTAFGSRDYKAMQSCYADDAVFSDAVFINLDCSKVKSLWEMLCVRGKDLRIEFSNVVADDITGHAEWTAYYTFSSTGRKVINRIEAYFEFENGKISRHTDTFSFNKWARQALGFKGLVLGWTSFLQDKVRKTAMRNLKEFMRGGR